MGVTFAVREPHGAPPELLLLLLAFGAVGYTLARHWPWTRWIMLAAVLVLAYWPIRNLIEWGVGAMGSATYMWYVHADAALEAAIIAVAGALPILGAGRTRPNESSASRLTTR